MGNSRMNLSKKLIELKESIEESKNELMKLEGKKEEYNKMLNEELKKYNITEKEVKKFLTDLKVKIEETEAEIEKELEELEELL